MLLRNKKTIRARELRSRNNPNFSSRNESQQTIQVRKYMQSIDPMRNESWSSEVIGLDASSRNNKSKSSLPFLPPQEAFGMESPIRSPPSLLRKKKKKKISSVSSPLVSSGTSPMVSSPFSSSGLFYSSNRMQIKTNPVKVIPFPRKNLFLSPTRATVNNVPVATPTSLRVDRSLLQERSSNNCSKSMSIRHGTMKLSKKKRPSRKHTNKKHRSVKVSMKTPSRCNRKLPANDGLFEADPPVMGRESSNLIFDSPMTPESTLQLSTMETPPVFATPTKERCFGAFSTPAIPTIVTNPWHMTKLPPSRSPPKRVSLDTGKDSPLTLPNQDSTSKGISSIPILKPQPSVGTTMAASALMSLMVIPGSNVACGSKRPIDLVETASSPIKKFGMTSNLDSFSTPRLFNMDNGENIASLSNVSGTSSFFHQPDIGYGEERYTGIINRSARKNYSNAANPSSCSGKRSISPSFSVNSAFKRIPKRFMDDPTLPVLKSGMRLAAPDDSPENLNSLHRFVRSELLEVFVVEDCKTILADGSSVSQIPRVGIRCVHCGHKPKCERAGVSMSTFYPKSIQDIYRGVCTWQRIHCMACKHIPVHLKKRYKEYKKSDKSRGKKDHWTQTALKMGLRNVDEHRNGVVWVGSTDSNAMGKMAFNRQRVSPQPRTTMDLTRLDETATNEYDNHHFAAV